LLHLQDEDLTPESVVRLEPIHSQRTLSLATLQANSPIDPQEQIRLAADIRKNARSWHARLSWTAYPDSEQLEFCCKLIYDYFVKRPRDGVASGRQLWYKLRRLRATQSIRGFIEDVLQNDTRAGGQPDAAVRLALEFQRKWGMFNFPRLLIALERVQEEVFRRIGLAPGRYGRYASDVESLFVAPELTGLDEYGLPMQLGLKLGSRLRLNEGMDAAIASVRALRPDSLPLTGFERYLIKHAQGGL